MEKKVKIGIVGFGTIGIGVVKLIQEQAGAIAARTGLRLEIACVVDIDTRTKRPVKLAK
jgi:homoserine dehydrogenase